MTNCSTVRLYCNIDMGHYYVTFDEGRESSIILSPRSNFRRKFIYPPLLLTRSGCWALQFCSIAVPQASQPLQFTVVTLVWALSAKRRFAQIDAKTQICSFRWWIQANSMVTHTNFFVQNDRIGFCWVASKLKWVGARSHLMGAGRLWRAPQGKTPLRQLWSRCLQLEEENLCKNELFSFFGPVRVSFVKISSKRLFEKILTSHQDADPHRWE